MKALSKHIFSLIPLLLVVTFVAAQDPDKPVAERADTLKATADSLKVAPEPVKVKSDTSKTAVDTLRVFPDSLNIRSDTLRIRQDTIITPVDSIIPNPDSTRQITGREEMVKDTIPAIQNDSLISKPGRKAREEKPAKLPREKQPRDTIKGPSGIELFLDYSKMITLPSGFEKKAEGGAGINIHEKILLLFEMGYGKISPEEAIKNGEYTSEGTYLRGGATYGGEIMPKTYLYLGLMYGQSQFEDSGTVLIESQAWDDLDGTFSRTGLKASWYEIILVSETEFKKNLFLGSKWRLRMLNSFQNDYIPAIYSIPGYGRTFDDSIPAVNLYIKYRFAF